MMGENGEQNSQGSGGSGGSEYSLFKEILNLDPMSDLISKVITHKSTLQDKQALYMSWIPRQQDILGCKIETLERLVSILNRAYQSPVGILSKEVEDLNEVICTVKGKEEKMKKAISYCQFWFGTSKTESLMQEAVTALNNDKDCKSLLKSQSLKGHCRASRL